MKRRQFLLDSANVAMSTAYLYGLQSLIETCFGTNRAFAQSSEETFYLNIQIPGAPPRWYFDQPINPSNKPSDIVRGNFGTEIRKVGASFRPIHRGYKFKFGDQDVYLPPVWKLKSAGTGKMFKELLDNTIMIRGVDMEINSHIVNRTRIVRPVASQPSINGLVADQSSRPLPCVGFSGSAGTTSFKSEKGQSAIQVAVGNPIPNLVDSFKGKIIKADELDHAVTQVIESLDSYANERGLSSSGGEEQQMSAYKMFDRNLAAFNNQYKALYKKYQGIISKELRANFPNVTSVNPVSDNSEFFGAGRGLMAKGPLKNTIVSGTHINRMAMAFAFSEFALTQKLSSAVTVDTGGSVMQGVNTVGNVTCDQHFVGGTASVFYTSLFFRSLLGCLTELKSALENANMFDKTLIHIMSEFSRTPQSNGAGADHGFNGASATLISGMIDEPGLIGNIRKNPVKADKKRYPGTWGEAAPFNFSSGRRLIVNDDVVNTVCDILGVKRIAVKGQSFIKKSGGRVSMLKKWEVKNV